MYDERTFPRADWVRLYGRSFRRTKMALGRVPECQHVQALAFLGEPRKDNRYTVDVECSCGATETYEIGVPLRETPHLHMTGIPADETVESRNMYEMSRDSTVSESVPT